jgi:hypothetical protein
MPSRLPSIRRWHPGDFAGGLDDVERALVSPPNRVRAYRAKGWLLMNSGRPTEGREATLSAMRIYPRSTLDVVPRSHVVETYYVECDYENELQLQGVWWQNVPTIPGPIGGWPTHLGNSAGSLNARCGNHQRTGRLLSFCATARTLDVGDRL